MSTELTPTSTTQILLGVTSTITAEDMRRMTDWINNSDVVTRWILLHIFENEGHRKLHKQTFEDYCTDCLKMNYSKEYYSALVRAARVEKTLFGPQTMADLTSPDFPRIPIKALLLASSIPESDLKDAYEEWKQRTEAAQAGAISSANAMTELKRIATRRIANTVAPPPETEFDRQLREGSPQAEETPPHPVETQTQESVADQTTFTNGGLQDTHSLPQEGRTEERESGATDLSQEDFPFQQWREALLTVQAWIDNEEIDGSRKDILWAMSQLEEISAWLEAQR